jgi:hypothetical protein
MNDIIIHSCTFAEHITHLRIVLEVLNSENLLNNPDKCEFARVEIIILGYSISETGIRLAKVKLLGMEGAIKRQHDQKRLGFFYYFKVLIPLFSTLKAPSERLRKKPKVIWT